jgi:iron complex transport system ATP-binding protein
VQGYVFRVATVTIGGWLLDDVVVDSDPARWSIAIGRGRPNAVHLDGDVGVVAGGVGDVHATLIDGHLARLVDTAHRACRVGEALLWGNVAASCAAAFSAFADARAGVADRAAMFFDTARPDVRDAGRLVRVGNRFAWERRSCCLWYRTDSGFMCEDCSLRPAAEHEARYTAMAEVGR